MSGVEAIDWVKADRGRIGGELEIAGGLELSCL